MATWQSRAALPETVALGFAGTDTATGLVYAYLGSGTSVYYDPAVDAWTQMVNPIAPSVEALGVVPGDGLYFIRARDGSGNQQTYRFDFGTALWSTAGETPAPGGQLSCGHTFDSQGRIYLIQGFINGQRMNTVRRYDTTTKAWADLTAHPQFADLSAAASDPQDRVYTLGGSLTNGVSARLYRYDPVGGTWTRLADAPVPRVSHRLAWWAGHLYAIGGFDNNGVRLARVDRYDPATDTWGMVPDYPVAVAGLLVAATADGILAGGGDLGGTGPGSSSTSAVYFFGNTAPNAPILVAPPDGSVLNVAVTQRFDWDFSDPDPGDTQSAYSLRYRAVGAPTWVETGWVAIPNTYRDIASGTFADGTDYEWQVATKDSLGVEGPFSGSGFFTGGTPPTGLTITAPTSGATIIGPTEVIWSTPDQSAYQVRKVADIGGVEDTATVYFDTGEVSATSTRSLLLDFPVNDRHEHIQVRVKSGGLWSAWASVRVLVSFTPPETPAVVIITDDASGTMRFTASTPTPGPGVPTTAYVDLEVRETGRPETALRVATGKAPDSTFAADRWLPRSGVDYEARVIGVGDNGTTAASEWSGASTPVLDYYFGGGFA